MLFGLLVACTEASLDADPGPGGRSPRPDLGGDDSGAADTAGDTGGADSGDTGGGDSGGGDTGVDPSLPAWTVLVFVNGDNDLEKWAFADVNEMEVVGSTDEVNVIVQLDRAATGFGGDGNWSGARRYRIEADTELQSVGSPVLEELGDVDSGDPSTVEDFVRWGLENWPAQHTMLVLWDHGDGWSFAPEEPETKAISYDDTSGTVLSVAGGDVTQVVHTTAGILGRKLDIIGFDACTMGQWEVATAVADDARLMVASEDYEDVAGWPYDDVLTDLAADPEMTPEALGESVALRFHEIPDSTMSVIDLEALPALNTALDAVAERVISTGVAGPLLAAAADGAQGWDGQFSREHDLIDLLDGFAEHTDDAELGAAVAAARAAAEATILTNYNRGGSVKNSFGLAIWSPDDGAMPPIYSRAPWSASSRWDDMIEAAKAP